MADPRLMGELLAGPPQAPARDNQMLADALFQRGAFLPLGRIPGGPLELAWPAFLHDPAMAWKRLIDTGEQPSPGEMLDFAGLAGVGAPLGLARGGVAPRASRSVSMYNPPAKPARSFEADYPQGARADAEGRLTHDIEGRPLTAERVVGRRVVGGEDQALAPAEFDAVTAAATGRNVEAVAPSAFRRAGTVGEVVVGEATRRPLSVALSNKLTPQQAVKVHAHELGHVIDQLAGEIPVKGLSAELKALYNTLNNPNRNGAEAARWGKPYSPDAAGYKGPDVPREWMAEAIRAYMVDPNYIKTVARETAAAIRKAVNENPEVARVIQFNVGGIPLFGAEDPAP